LLDWLSAADPRADAWRCMAGFLILDPCFEDKLGSSPFLVCVPDPWARQGVKLRLTRPLPRTRGNLSDDPTRSPPWALETANRKRCSFITGVTSHSVV
jgi:hypothetical protein